MGSETLSGEQIQRAAPGFNPALAKTHRGAGCGNANRINMMTRRTGIAVRAARLQPDAPGLNR
jgi:hypothetical protein